MGGDQRARAGGVDRDRRAVEVEEVGNPVGDDRTRCAGDGVRVGDGRIRHRQEAVVVHRRANEDADRFTAQAGRRNAGVLECLPGQLEGHPLLRVDVVGFGLGQREELGVETLDVTEISAAGARLLDRLGQPRFVHEFRPATLGQVGDRVAAFQQRGPGLIGGVHVTRQPGGQTDDGDVDPLDGSGSAPVEFVGVGGVEFGVALDDPGGQRLDGRVLERGRDRDGDSGGVLDVGRHRHRVARGQPQLHHRRGLVDRVGRLAGGLGDPVAQPLPHLSDGHRRAGRGDGLRVCTPLLRIAALCIVAGGSGLGIEISHVHAQSVWSG